MAPRYKLKLKRLDFISAVDAPAQETATAVLLKDQSGAAQITARARVVKMSDELGLVFGWALTVKSKGVDYFDLQGDNIVEEDLIRVAAEFMANGGATDQQHDFEADGRVVFAMPLTAEVAKSFGIQTDTTGLMVAIKPSADAFAKFKSGEYTGFSIAGIGEREQVAKTAKVVKASLYTNEVDGHQHTVRVCDDGSLYVEWATATGADNGHSHGVIFEDGKLTILADSGHTHEMAEGQPGLAIVPADTLVVVQARADQRLLMPGISDEKTASRIAAREAAAAKSTRSGELPHGDPMKVIVLTEAQHEHYSKLSGKDAESYLEKSGAERDGEIEKMRAADPVVFKGELSGIEVRKSQGDFALKLAQANEESKAALKKQAEELEVAKAAREATEIRKRAAETLGKLTGGDDIHDLIVRAVLKSNAKAEDIAKALDAMKGWNALAGQAGVAKGENPGQDPTAPNAEQAYQAFEKGLVDFAKGKDFKNVWTDARAAFEQTPEGAALKKAHEEARKAG